MLQLARHYNEQLGPPRYMNNLDLHSVVAAFAHFSQCATIKYFSLIRVIFKTNDPACSCCHGLVQYCSYKLLLCYAATACHY